MFLALLPAAAASTTDAAVVSSTLRWVDGWIIKRQLCPFAAAVRPQTRTVVCRGREAEAAAVLQDEVRALRSVDEQKPATTLLVLPDFHDFADLMHLQEIESMKLDAESDASGAAAIQLLAFHPRAEFGDDARDPADLSMRSPHPMLHLLRDADVEAAEESWARMHAPSEPPGIQERNAALLRGLGFEAAAAELKEAVGGAEAPS